MNTIKYTVSIFIIILFTINAYCIDNDNTFLITIDDGPNEYTTDIVNELNSRNIKCIFFITGNGKKLDKYKYVSKEIMLGGHIIGNHTISHDMALLRHGTKLAVYSDIYFLSAYYKNTFNYTIKYFRPPYGLKRKDIFPLALVNMNMENMLWNIDICVKDIVKCRKNNVVNMQCLKRVITKQLKMYDEKDDHIVLMHSNEIISRNIGKILDILSQYGRLISKNDKIKLTSDYKYIVIGDKYEKYSKNQESKSH